MNAVTVFNFQENHPVRIQIINNEPWFCLRDVCKVLDLNIRSSEAFGLDEKGMQKLCTPTKSGNQQITFINEPNLYRVIFRSNKSEARQFQDWVFNDVLPAIRKTGSYQQQPQAKPEYLTNKDMLSIKRLIWLCTHQMNYSSAGNQGIWFALRQATGVPSPQKFEVKHLAAIENEFLRIFSIIHPYIEAKRECELAIIKRLVRGREDVHPVLSVLLKEMQQSVQDDAKQYMDYLTREFANDAHKMRNRNAGIGYDYHQCNEIFSLT